MILPLLMPAADRSFAFELRDGFMWVKVRVAASPEPLHFLVDTGAEVSTLNLGTARRLKLKGGRRVKVAGVGGRATGYWPLKLQADVAGFKLPQHFLVADLCALEAACHCPVDGLVGADFFQGRITQIDFVAREVRLLAAPPPQIAGAVPLRFRRSIMQVPVTVNGQGGQWVRLDTGCASALEWVCARTAKQAKASRISIGLTGLRVPTIQTCVEIAGRSFDDVETGLHAEPIFATERGLLGLGLIGRFRYVTIDTPAERLILSEPLQ